MSAKIIDGKALAEQIKAEIRTATDALAAAGKRRPGLAVIMVGDSAASEVYVRNKRRSCEQAGIVSSAHDLPASTSEAELLALIHLLNADTAIDGILVQLPLPPQIRTAPGDRRASTRPRTSTASIPTTSGAWRSANRCCAPARPTA